MLGLRIGQARCAVTTTPRPVRLIRDLIAAPHVAVVKGKTVENAKNLSAAFMDTIVARYAGTRLGRQELEAELLEDVPGALWNREQLDRCRIASPPALSRIVIAIDPAGGSDERHDETGIVVVGRAAEGGSVYVLDDLSGRYSPDAWARRAINALHGWQGDRLVCEANYGGAMVESTLRAVDPNAPIKMVTASRGKILRAEPVAALYEQSKVHHVGAFPSLEDQMAGFSAGWDRSRDGSPDRVDALVFAVAELGLSGGFDWGKAWSPDVRQFARPDPRTCGSAVRYQQMVARRVNPHRFYR